MSQPPLDNQTDFQAHPQLILTPAGERLLVMVKATFELVPEEPALVLAPEDRARGFRFADVGWEKDDPSSIKYPADVCYRKPATDVIIVGKAWASEGKAVPSFDVLAEVGPLRKMLKVHGMRLWLEDGVGLSKPRPTAEVELRYDNAWGGVDDSDPEHVVAEPRNPIGRGVVRKAKTLTHQLAPSIEDPEYPIQSRQTRPPPAGVGAIGRHWEPRLRYVGTYDDVWKETRAPLPPTDEDDRVHLCASSGLIADPPLVGGEDVRLLNLTLGGGVVQFALPKVKIGLGFLVKGREPELQVPHLDTVVIDTLLTQFGLPLTVELVWRGSVKAPRRLEDSETIVKELAWS